MTLTLKCPASCFLHLNVQLSCLVELRGVWTSRDVAPLIIDSCSKCRLALSLRKEPPVPCDKRDSVVCPALSDSHLHIKLLCPALSYSHLHIKLVCPALSHSHLHIKLNL